MVFSKKGVKVTECRCTRHLCTLFSEIPCYARHIIRGRTASIEFAYNVFASIFAQVMNHLAVEGVETLARDVAPQVIVAVDDRQPLGTGAFK